MADGISLRITDNSDEVLDELESAAKRALMVCGQKAQDNAVTIITRNGNVDTGLLRNSIAFAIGGKAANPSSYSASDGSASGKYSGSAPSDSDGKYTVYLGTNVEYAQNIECGTSLHPNGWPFIVPAIKDYADKYKRIFKEELGG